MTIRWEPAAGGVRYFVDDEAVGEDDAGFARLLDRVGAGDGPVTVRVGTLPLGGQDLTDALPFADRMGELEQRLAGRRLEFTSY